MKKRIRRINTRRVAVPSGPAAESLRPYVVIHGIGGQLAELDRFIARHGRKHPLYLRLRVKGHAARELIGAYTSIDWKTTRNVVLLVPQQNLPDPAEAARKAAAADKQLAHDLALPIEELDLSVGTYNPLKREGINTIGELVTWTEEGLLTIRYIAGKRVGEIKARLRGMGLALAEPNRAPALKAA